MAKLYKIEGYLCDVNGDFKGAEDFKDYLQMIVDRDRLLLPIDFKITESKEIEWHDDIDINYLDCTEEDCKKYFE